MTLGLGTRRRSTAALVMGAAGTLLLAGLSVAVPSVLDGLETARDGLEIKAEDVGQRVDLTEFKDVSELEPKPGAQGSAPAPTPGTGQRGRRLRR